MTFSESILDAADDNGQISWIAARRLAIYCGLWDDFKTDYGTTANFGGVDAGEFCVWLGF